MKIKFNGVKAAEYERVHDEVLKAGTPDGLLLHTAGKVADGWFVYDVWESVDAFKHFADDVMMPAVSKVGVKTDAQPVFIDLHNVWAPGVTKLGKIGADARPMAHA